MEESTAERSIYRTRIVKIIKAYETFCDKNNFTEDEQKYVQDLLTDYSTNELMDKQDTKNIYDKLTTTISPKIVEELKKINYCDTETLDCLNNKPIVEIKNKKAQNCSVGGKQSKRRKQRKNNHKSI